MTVDTQGLPHAIELTTADVTDRDGALWMFLLNVETLSTVVKLLVDSAYTGEPFAQRVKMMLGAEVEIARRRELHKFAVIPKHWVVERSFAWLDKCRRLWKNCEHKPSGCEGKLFIMNGEKMLKSLRLACALFAVSCFAPVHAQSNMVVEAQTLVKKAKEHLKKRGVEQACKDFADPNAGFQNGELYVVVQDIHVAGQVKMVCHGKNARLNGKEMIDLKDADGKQFNKEIPELIKTKGQGWVDYRWVNPVSGALEAKTSYIEAQDGLVLMVGIYKK